MGASPIKRDSLQWEARMATVSLAGVRPLANGTVAVGASAEGTYTITRLEANRVVVFHASGGDVDVRIDLNATATATDFPVASGVYFVLEVEKDDVVHVFNTSGGSINVYFLEIQ